MNKLIIIWPDGPKKIIDVIPGSVMVNTDMKERYTRVIGHKCDWIRGDPDGKKFLKGQGYRW